ncbi:MAG: glycoside hydrolase family 97 protein, partial [Gemmatimonadota bacterium]
IKTSRLGFILKNEPPLAYDFVVASKETNSVDETWTQPWGEKKDIRNHYNELRLNLVEPSKPSRKMTVVFRVYDDGLGFRYEIPEQPQLTDFEIMDELTEFALTGDHEAWWIPAYWWNRYEYLYRRSPVSTMDTVHTPVTMETEDGLFLSFHEAALTDFASMTLERRGDCTLKADLVPWSDGVRVKTSAPMVTPWRTIQIADTPGGLITSYLILNLNEPNKLDDVSWIKPGKYVGIWWEMHLGISTWGSGPTHGATTENAKRYIDFAAKYGFDGVLVEGWNVGWDGDWIKNSDKFRFTEPHEDFDINDVVRYASEKNVELIGHHETGGGINNYDRQMTDAYAYYERLGVRIVKSGYVAHDREIKRIDEKGEEQGEWHHGQFMVRYYRKAVEEAAKHHIMLNVHEPIKDTGIRRTYPNMMTREGSRGQEFNAWSGDGGNPPEHTTILPFTRFLGGPMDFTPGIFDLHFEEANRPDNRVNTTLAKQLALYVVLYSPLHMAADLPENYEANLEPFQFIVDVPTDWQNTKVLHSRIGDYVTVVRQDRNSEDWYLGSITDEEGRVLEAPLQFLDPARKYVAEIYRDGALADWITNPYDIEIEERLVDNGTMLTLRLAPGGGQAIRFRPATENDVR